MATTNATITINSDIMSYSGSVSTEMTMKKFGSTVVAIFIILYC